MVNFGQFSHQIVNIHFFCIVNKLMIKALSGNVVSVNGRKKVFNNC
jgi:hypothetical protein